MKLFVKNMVCPRCKMAVENILNQLDIPFDTVELGKITLKNALPLEKIRDFEKLLLPLGFELLDDKRHQTVERIKNILIDLIQNQNAVLKTNLSTYLSDLLHSDYNALSQLFSQIESTTIEQYFISLKTERVKELLIYDELSLKEIAFQLNYSSTAHLSKQFKKATGLTPTGFKEIKEHNRNSLETI